MTFKSMICPLLQERGKTLAFALGTLRDAVDCIDNDSDLWSLEVLH